MKGRELPPPSGTNTKPGTEHRQPTLSSAHPASHHNSPNSITQGTFVFITLLAESLSTALFTPIKAAICVPLNGVLSSNAASFSFAYPRAMSSVTVITGIWGERKMQGALLASGVPAPPVAQSLLCCVAIILPSVSPSVQWEEQSGWPPREFWLGSSKAGSNHTPV